MIAWITITMATVMIPAGDQAAVTTGAAKVHLPKTPLLISRIPVPKGLEAAAFSVLEVDGKWIE